MTTTQSDLRIFGYRTNEDYTQTLSWSVGADGRVNCHHLAIGCCADCVTADSRLLRRRGTVVVVRTNARL